MVIVPSVGEGLLEVAAVSSVVGKVADSHTRQA